MNDQRTFCLKVSYRLIKEAYCIVKILLKYNIYLFETLFVISLKPCLSNAVESSPTS